VVLVWLFLPKMGMEGYILVIYIAELLNASLSIARLLKITGLKPPVRKILFLPLFSVIGGTAVVRIAASFASRFGLPFSGGISGLTVHILLSVLFYGVFLLLLGGVEKTELRNLYHRLKKKKS
ncbi:MAG: polysaccharide biosynthesis C-terminal domain-containing protein, partial [Clostridia bacterium]|nr:polysaccharide biosynthesis C-terminal domain-containing protein [Clostridia bacterium]